MIDELQYVNPANYVSGIYKITSIASGHYYYGSAINLRKRCGCHLYSLRANSHSNKYMQNVYNKYRNRLWLFEVIEFIPPQVALLKAVEQVYLDKYVGTPLCMNLNPIAYGPPKSLLSDRQQINTKTKEKKFCLLSQQEL